MARIDVDINDTSIEPLSEGPYRAKVKKMTVQPKKPGKEYPTMRVDFKVTPTPEQMSKASADGTYPLVDFLSLSPQAGWKLEEFFKGCGMQEGVHYQVIELGDKRKRLTFNTEDVEGRECLIILSVNPERDASGNPKANGRIRNEVESYAAI